jgi:hypothetical protein
MSVIPADPERLSQLLRELEDLNIAVSIINGKIQTEEQLAGSKLIASEMDEINLRRGKLAKSLVCVCGEDSEYDQYLDSLESAGASVGHYRIRLPGLGSPRDISSGYAYSLREFIDAGVLKRSDLPKAFQ